MVVEPSGRVTNGRQEIAERARAESANRNVSAILSLEHEALAARSRAERVSDIIAGHAGRMWFLVAHAIWFNAWIILNSPLFPDSRKSTIPTPVSDFRHVVGSHFLSLFILMGQNRSTKQADARSHLDLQINLLAEQESTKMLQLLGLLCKHHKFAILPDPELEQLKATTEPAALLRPEFL